MAQDTQTYDYNVRFPADMEEKLKEAAAEEFRSVNGLIVAAVKRHLQWHDQIRGRTQPEAQEA